jgi:hypothetical protein
VQRGAERERRTRLINTGSLSTDTVLVEATSCAVSVLGTVEELGFRLCVRRVRIAR